MQIKTARRYHFTPEWLLPIRNFKKKKGARKDSEKE
jgi:hypothetical protein